MANRPTVKVELDQTEQPRCSLCPCPDYTAYWTPPPSWPRHLLCESRLLACSFSRLCWLGIAAVTLIYFFIMDIVLFTRFRDTDLVKEFSIVTPGEIYLPFTHLSIKGILNDHPSQFIIAPSTEYFDMLTRFSSVFYFITPNMISIAHLVCGFIAGKFLASDQLQDRRIGVVLFEFRTWLDAFDGTVHRAQTGLRLHYHSNHATLGYVVDSVFDTLGGFFLSFGILFYLLKRFGPSKVLLPVRSNFKDGKDGLTPEISQTRDAAYSARYLFLRTLCFGVCLAVAGKGWDQAVEDFTNVFQVPLKDPELSMLQYTYCHSYTSITIFYLWRLFGSQSVLNYVLIAIYADKTWEFLRFMPYILLSVAVVLYVITCLYINQIRSDLHL